MATQVEVFLRDRKTYYLAEIRDVRDAELLVAFVNGFDGREEWVDQSCVRPVPAAFEEDSFAPIVGDVVEMRVQREKEPAGWVEGRVKSVKSTGSFVVSVPAPGGASTVDELVSLSDIRPAAGARRAHYEKTTVPVPKEKREIIAVTASLLGDLCALAGCLAVFLDKAGENIVVVGAKANIARARPLVLQHFSQVESLGALQRDVNSLNSKLEEERVKVERGCRMQFDVDSDHISLVIGKKGANIKKAEAVEGIHRVAVDQNKVTIFADNEDAAWEAREILEFVSAKQPVEPEQVGGIIGRGGKNINEIQKLSGVQRMNVYDDYIEFVGTRNAVDTARSMVQMQARYMDKRAELDVQVNALHEDLRTLGIPTGRGPYRERAAGGESNGNAEHSAGAGEANGAANGDATGPGRRNRRNRRNRKRETDGAAAADDSTPSAASAGGAAEAAVQVAEA